jgi:hypothetical protein
MYLGKVLHYFSAGRRLCALFIRHLVASEHDLVHVAHDHNVAVQLCSVVRRLVFACAVVTCSCAVDRQRHARAIGQPALQNQMDANGVSEDLFVRKRLALPCKICAKCVANRPATLPVASTCHHLTEAAAASRCDG